MLHAASISILLLLDHYRIINNPLYTIKYLSYEAKYEGPSGIIVKNV